MLLNWVKGNTVGEVEKSAKDHMNFLQDNVMAMVLSGGLYAEMTMEAASHTERYINEFYGEMVHEIDCAMGARERNRRFLEERRKNNWK